MFVRTAGERDLEEIRALLAETWHATYDPIYGADRVDQITNDWHSIQCLRARLTRPNAEFVVADDGATIGGVAYAASSKEPKVVTLHQIYVLPDRQRRGIGTMLLAEIVGSFPQAELIRLEIESENRKAIAFCAAHGFRDARITSDRGAPADASSVVLERRLLS